MILDSIDNCELYYALSPRLEAAFNYLKNTDLAALENGRHEIDGDDIFINVMTLELKERSEAKLEVHNTYLDIQVLISGDFEEFGWSERKHVSNELTQFDNDKDVQFYGDVPQCFYSLKKEQFTILLPEDAHAPMLGCGEVKKAIVKVRL